MSDTEICKVCGAPAARHFHYGATTCFSCRAFFRRSVRVMQEKPYRCRKMGSCQVTPKTRKNCQKCRFQKCLDIGMKPGWVLNEQDRARRFRKTIEKKGQMAEGEPVNSPEEHEGPTTD